MDKDFKHTSQKPDVRLVNPLLITNQLKFNREALECQALHNRKINGRFIEKKRYSGLIVPGAALTHGQLFDTCPHVKALHKRYALKKPWHRIGYYKLYETWYKPLTGRSFEYFYYNKLLQWDEIYTSIKCFGHKASMNPLNNIEVAVTQDCEVLFVDGRHRLFFAKLLKLPLIPVTVNSVAAEAINKLTKTLRLLSIDNPQTATTHDS